MNFSTFPDCSICKCLADDGGWLDNKNYRFWVCIDCDDYLDTIERKKMNSITDIQFEAIIWAMFQCENEIQHLEYLIISTDDENLEVFLEGQVERRNEHFKALKDLLNSYGRDFTPYEDGEN
jgi:hypothetical protein